MPIIKDKYGAKGAQTRSKYVTRRQNRAIITDSIPPNVQTTAQKQAIETKATKELTNPPSINAKTQTFTGAKLAVINTPELLFTLTSGNSLNDIIISHYSASGSSVVGIYWSTSPISYLTFTASGGIISATEGGTIYRLVTEEIPSSSSLSLNEILNNFNSFSKDIYFYAVCSRLGPELTIIGS